MRTTPLFASFFAALLFSQAAFAQDAPPPSAHAAPAPGPDVVRLKDGSIFRGTIVELVAGDHVDLLTANGEIRRFPMASVESAGSAQAPPPPQPAAVSPERDPNDKADLKVVANEPGVEVQVKTGKANLSGFTWTGGRHGGIGAFSGTASVYSTLCIAPCRTSLPVGSHRLGLTLDKDSSVVEVESPVSITGPGTLRADYESRRGLRIAGLVTGLGGGLVGLGLFYASFDSGSKNCDSYGFCMKGAPDSSLLYGGLGLIGVSTLVGFILVLQPDKATVTFVPGAPSPIAGHGGMETAGASADPRGAMVRVRF